MLKCRQLCKVYRFYSIVIFIYLFEVTCFRCNLQTFLNVFSLKIVIFKREYLETEIFSDYTVKEKNSPFFLKFPNISFFHMIVNYWTGPLNQTLRENGTALATFFEGSWILLKTTFFICFRLVNNIYAILVYVSRVLAEL